MGFKLKIYGLRPLQRHLARLGCCPFCRTRSLKPRRRVGAISFLRCRLCLELMMLPDKGSEAEAEFDAAQFRLLPLSQAETVKTMNRLMRQEPEPELTAAFFPQPRPE